ncbi:hypothetical protein CMV_006991 [Castanea mollissima]|uniref:Uncharacterized protein n=1 Tax=Castanea mollissima TaxID=60419 RepID=A0A8J4VSY1_9ROSI|nr:hypothetical protein CMV_006991 [Castanea mollissima]
MGMELEFVALIDSYCEKWYSLRRGNLKATHCAWTPWRKVLSAKPRVNDSDSDENDNNNDEGLDIKNEEEEEDQDLYKEFKNGGSNMRHMSSGFFCLVAEKVLRKLGKNCISQYRLKFKLVL